jgi:hypothetical protein
MCESCETLRGALQASEVDLRHAQSSARMYRRDAEQAWRVASTPDARLSAQLAEALAEVERLTEQCRRLDFRHKRAVDAKRKMAARVRSADGRSDTATARAIRTAEGVERLFAENLRLRVELDRLRAMVEG